jgi:hypothetical protein
LFTQISHSFNNNHRFKLQGLFGPQQDDQNSLFSADERRPLPSLIPRLARNSLLLQELLKWGQLRVVCTVCTSFFEQFGTLSPNLFILIIRLAEWQISFQRNPQSRFECIHAAPVDFLLFASTSGKTNVNRQPNKELSLLRTPIAY